LKLTEAGRKDPLLKDFTEGERVFQMHQDMFETPKNAIHLAATELVPGQAIRFGEKVYGLQFHLEADEPMIRRWISRPEHQAVIQSSHGKFNKDLIVAETEKQIERSLILSQSAFSEFIKIFNLPERPVLLGSR
jgi:GMP synthase (glutamine-hydrolysing)